MTDPLDPTAPLRTIEGATIRQRVGGSLYVRWETGEEEDYPAGLSVTAVELDVRKRLGEAP